VYSAAWQQAAPEAGAPVAFHCAQGKDRTGMVAKLVGAVILTPVSASLVENYVFSERNLPGQSAMRDILESSARPGDFVSTLWMCMIY